MSSRQQIFWRKQLILRRDAIEVQWRTLFPSHDFNTLRLIQPKMLPPSGWSEHWAAAAREYHEERRKFGEKR